MSSLWHRISMDANNAMNDVYSHYIIGDDAGKSMLLAHIIRKAKDDGPELQDAAATDATDATDDDNTSSNELGMTFIEMNGRAYVKSVVPGSPAHRAGVVSQDAVQLAIPIPIEWEQEALALYHDETDNNNDNTRENEEQYNDKSALENINLIARTYGYKLEKKGARTSYNQLYHLLASYYNSANNQQYFVSPLTSMESSSKARKKNSNFSIFSIFHSSRHRNDNSNVIVNTRTPWDEPPTPSKLCGPVLYHPACNNADTTTTTATTALSTNNHSNTNIEFQNSYLNFDRKRSTVSSTEEEDEDDDDPSINNSNNNNRQYRKSSSSSSSTAILFIFRRTRQRQVVKETTTSACLVPSNFRMDDECDVACSVLRRLAPTADMEPPIPDTWEELIHDSTDWLLGSNTKNTNLQEQQPDANTNNVQNLAATTATSNYYAGSSIYDNNYTDSIEASQQQHHDITSSSAGAATIPLDSFEQSRTQKLTALRTRITAETMLLNSRHNHSHTNRTDDVEAATVRAMIQKAVGLAFVRASKVVLGVSIHGGSGIVISRLPDGTWSAPSAIGTWGFGLGIQFGLEVAEYIFILQTEEAMEHFKRGESYTVGGNMGIAIGGLGREAYGAASVAGGNSNSGNMICGNDTTISQQQQNLNGTLSASTQNEEYNDEDDADNDNNEKTHKQMRMNHNIDANATSSRSSSGLGIAPIVAYAKSQGLYIGVSLEGSRIFTRNDINCRTYKFASGKDVSAYDILSGKVPTPPEAEELYAALHSVEFTHEMSQLPRPPDVLRKDSANAWTYDRSISVESKQNFGKKPPEPQEKTRLHHQQPGYPFSFFNALSARETDECTNFEAQFKNFLYGGVSVQRLIVDTEGGSDRTSKERRTLWLMLPEIGSLRIGFVSKISDGEGGISNKSSTQRARRDDTHRTNGTGYDGDNGTVGSEELTLDSALLTKDGSISGPIRQGNAKMSESHSVALTDVVNLSQEPPVQMKFRGEDKTQHLRVISIQDVSGANLLFLANNFREAEILVCGLKLLLERETARLGVRGGVPISALGGSSSEGAMSPAAARGFRELPSSKFPQLQSKSDHSSRKTNDIVSRSRQSIIEQAANRKINANNSHNWGKQPGRDYMRGQASTATDPIEADLRNDDIPTFVYDQSVIKSIAKNIRIPLPIPLCRVLLLDSTSPVITQWQKTRGDSNFDHSRWVFPPSTPRELERHASEHQLIASGSMSCAQRTTSFDRPRYGSVVRLSETYIVDSDDPKNISLFINENSPRRGFAVKIKIALRATKDNFCEATAIADVRPVGKDMSNQSAVHKAYLLVFEEIKFRYGTESNGLLGCFLSVVDEMANPTTSTIKNNPMRPLYRSDSTSEEKKSDNQSINSVKYSRNTKSSGLVSFEDMLKTGRESPEIAAAPRPETPSLNIQIPEANPAKRIANKLLPIKDAGEFAAADATLSSTEGAKAEPVLIEVKPLPKIRLALMPSPREEDEETSSSKSPFEPKPIKKKKKKKSSSASPKTETKYSPTKLSSDELKRHRRF